MNVESGWHSPVTTFTGYVRIGLTDFWKSVEMKGNVYWEIVHFAEKGSWKMAHHTIQGNIEVCWSTPQLHWEPT